MRSRTTFLLLCLLLLSACSKTAQTPKTVSLQKFSPQQKDTLPPKERLFMLTNKWLGTKYCYGGVSKKGVDCSALVQNLYKEAFGLKIPRTTKEQIKIGRKIEQKRLLREGDILIFKTGFRTLHSAIYLKNGEFVHASSSHGVTIANIHNPYWRNRFIEARRLDALDLLLVQ